MKISVQDINSAIIHGDFSNEQLNSIAMAVRYARGQITKQNIRTIMLGSQVQFVHPRQGRSVQGRVVKIGRKFVKVDAGGLVWRVPANMIEAV